MEYNTRIRNIREDKDLKQKEIAALLNIDQRMYSLYELGKAKMPVDRIIVLAKFYNLDMNYICGVSDDPKPFPQK